MIIIILWPLVQRESKVTKSLFTNIICCIILPGRPGLLFGSIEGHQNDLIQRKINQSTAMKKVALNHDLNMKIGRREGEKNRKKIERIYSTWHLKPY